MGKVELLAVTFTDNTKVYNPGSVLNGTVFVKLSKELKLRGIRIEFHGEARVKWTEKRHSQSSSGHSQTTTRTFTNKQIYINTSATLFGKAPGEKADNPVLPAGDYSYPFSFLIPEQNLPSSYEGKYGHVRYWLKVVIDRPWRFDVTTKAAFSMIELVDINVARLVNPMQQEIERNLGSFCCVSGPLTIIAMTDRGGYCPGESIAISLYINNKTNEDLPGIEVSLVQYVTFIASSGWSFDKQRSVDQEIKRLTDVGVRRGDEHHYPSMLLPIPSVPPSMSSCSCIRIHYELKVKVRVSGFNFNSKLKFPIVIGSVPYRAPAPPVQYYEPAVQPSAPPMMPDSYGPPSAPPPEYSATAASSYYTQPPPSYAECVHGGASIRDDDDHQDGAMGDMNFVPSYPFVNNYQPPTPQQTTAPPMNLVKYSNV